MPAALLSSVLANGLRADFDDTYSKIRNRQSDSRLSQVMDLGIGADNRQHEFGYIEAAPHMEYWRRGESIPTDAMGSVSFEVPVHNWARRVRWHKDDRKDDRTQSLYTMAQMAGESAALLPERMFFDVLTNSTGVMPVVPLAPDGAAMFAATAGGSARFGVTGGNLISGSGVATTAAILNDYYGAIVRWLNMQDGKGQPMFSAETIDAGILLLHSATDTEAMETAFLQKRQGVVLGTDAGTTPTNVVQDASRNVSLWGTSRLGSGTWYAFLKAAPKLPTFYMDREGVVELASLEGDNNSDYTRDTGFEYVQWEMRSGAGIALPYAAIKVAP